MATRRRERELAMERIALSAERLRPPDLPGIMSASAEAVASQELSIVEFTESVLSARVEAAILRATETRTRLVSFPAMRPRRVRLLHPALPQPQADHGAGWLRPH